VRLAEEADDRLLHRLWQSLVLSREHPTEAHAVLTEDVRINLGKGLEPRAGVAACAVDPRERPEEALRIALDQRCPELRLAGEVVVEARLCHAHLGRHVSLTEAVVATFLDEPLGDVQDPHRRHARIRSLREVIAQASRTPTWLAARCRA